MKKRWFKACFSLICFCILFVFLFQFLSKLIPNRDRRQEDVWQYLYHNKNTVSYLFLGSSHVYCGVNPMQMTETTGKEAVLISSGMQTLTETYYYMKEALKYQQPEIVYVDLYGAYKEFTETNYTNLDCMRLSLNKARLVREGFPETRLIDGLFPLIREHSNWKEFDNLKTNWESMTKTNPNYLFVRGFSGIDSAMSDEQYEGISNWEQDDTPFTLHEEDKNAIENIKELGEKKQVKVVFILIPWLDEYVQKINFGSFLKEITEATGNVLVLSQQEYRELGLSRETFIEDKASDNQHLNLKGAELYTNWLIEKTVP
ncbi:MAG: hypothetical protein E7399_06520 [Ruminococcaceae bacterium]|nr:hypothetical protein [Oscillospiraceae bacterium]